MAPRNPTSTSSFGVGRRESHDASQFYARFRPPATTDGAAGNCAWGSYRSPVNPVLRDLTERVVIASKGRFDRARRPRERQADGLAHETTISTDEFMAATLDVWRIDPESARRVNHP